MRFITKLISFILFSMLFIAIILPLGALIRLLADPHRLKRSGQGPSYFNFARDKRKSRGREATNGYRDLARKS